MSIPYQPLGNRLVVKPIPLTEEEKTHNGILLAESAIIFQKADVLKVGRGETAPASGEIIPMEVKEGSQILIRCEAPHLPLTIEGIEYWLMREPDIEAIIEK